MEMVTLFSCMCIMASDTLTEMESDASSMLNGPSNFSEIWYRASERGERQRQKETGQDDHVVGDLLTPVNIEKAMLKLVG